ncbi:MAG: cysteine desulfurase-like protein [Cyclobacteriaceae bacterium]|nr:cysteine desulfurase-like protein [Cyclobacteriaceae bacterium]
MSNPLANPTPVRDLFPSLLRKHNNQPLVFIDGPAGTQVPQSVIDSITHYYKNSNANTHGSFLTAKETDSVVQHTRHCMATLLGAESENCISIGQNMTTLNFALARAMSRILKPGDEVLITQLDHEANRGPWLTLRDFGVKVREVNLLPTGVLDYDDFAKKINENTKLVCMGMSANSIGTVNDFTLIRELTYKHNAWLLLDAVHYAPHFAIDVQAMGCDFLLCSAYKFYGPHVGILYSKPGLLDRLPTDRLRTAGQIAPDSIETGTLNHAAIAGVGAAVEFIASFGAGNTLREKIIDAYDKISQHEHKLASKLYESLRKLSGITVVGQDFSSPNRTPTVSFTVDGKTPLQVCDQLASKNIFAWDGHFYAIHAIEVLGLLERGGVTRMGISMYNTMEEIEFVLAEMKKICN